VFELLLRIFSIELRNADVLCPAHKQRSELKSLGVIVYTQNLKRARQLRNGWLRSSQDLLDLAYYVIDVTSHCFLLRGTAALEEKYWHHDAGVCPP